MVRKDWGIPKGTEVVYDKVLRSGVGVDNIYDKDTGEYL